MIAIDTNVLIRLLVDDPNEVAQTQLARQLLIEYGAAWVSSIVLIETVWVLQSRYKLVKEEIIAVIEKLISHPLIQLENAVRVHEALIIYRASNAGFSDCSILNTSKNQSFVLYTFDKKLSRLQGAKLISDKGKGLSDE